jgi:RNA polymerase sigma-70 factor (TIGR02943 family)
MPDPGENPRGAMSSAEWVDRYGATLYRFALSRLRDEDAAEEVVQETFVAALQAQGQYAGRGDRGAWLLGICKRKVVDFIRQRNRPDAASGAEYGTDLSGDYFDAKGNWRFDPRIRRGCPEDSLEREEFWQAFRGCLRGLPQRQADVFTLRELDEMAGDEICKELGITASNLWVLIHRARLQLTRCMKSHLQDWGVL